MTGISRAQAWLLLVCCAAGVGVAIAVLRQPPRDDMAATEGEPAPAAGTAQD